ncbi:unnamed protein product [Caenorhabditis bovis]|uniref:CW-type domain-containing protein n=1 Tax=Caenorhabditis bovis TaxID=2654633 RepID=A0A8S1EKJ3_9PELO|nr:unnamed protein product [Caenorhabditis bovis]
MAAGTSKKNELYGTTRNLTEVYILLRANAQQSKLLYHDDASTIFRSNAGEERMALVELEDGRPEPENSQPFWIHTADEVEFEFERIRRRLDELSEAQQRHLSRPNFGDETFEAEEKEMEATTEQITQMLTHSQRLIRMISNQPTKKEKATERKLRENTSSALSLTLSQITEQFRTRQLKYLNNIQNRSKNLDSFLLTASSIDEPNWADLDTATTAELTMSQLEQFMANDREVRDREKEILAVNTSIRELSDLFKDLSQMIVNQGTILDRIDYNCEQTSIRVQKAVDDVIKAEGHQLTYRCSATVFQMDTDKIKLLNKATIAFSYLHSNSTTHEYLLGAIAELVDNSRDANAENLHIDFDKDHEYLSILDDGCGMTQKEAVNVISFGFSNKRNIAGMIGQYGNGLKSGAMRIATDMLLLTKKDGILSCLLLSRTFHKEHDLKEVFVPSPSFNAEDRHMLCQSDMEIEKHRLEMSIIYKYSPFSDQNTLFAQFEKIRGEHGTLIILFNLRRLVTGQLELDFTSTEDDIRLTDHVAQREEEYNSLRAYLSVLYLNPRMKIYLRKKKITATRITSLLIMKYRYQYLAKNLKACATKEYEACKMAVKDAKERLSIAKSDYGTFTNTDPKLASKNDRLMQRVHSQAVEDAQKALKAAEEREVQAKKAISNPQPLSIVFGINIHHRNRYGCMFYNNGRLILAYQKGSAQKEKNDLMMTCLGVVGIVDVPYSVLAPTHNKQSFENSREYLSLLKAMNDLMMKYWNEIGIGSSPSAIKHFWKQYGYTNSDWTAEPADDLEGKRNRFNRTNHFIQCNLCLKWRRVPMQIKYISYGIPEDWSCANHPNASNRRCDAVEEVERIKEGGQKAEKQLEIAPVVKRSLSTIKVEQPPPRSTIDVEIEKEKERNGKKIADVIEISTAHHTPQETNNKPIKRTYPHSTDAESESEESENNEEDDSDADGGPTKKRVKKSIKKFSPEKNRYAPSGSSTRPSSSRMVGRAPTSTAASRPRYREDSDDEMPVTRKSERRSNTTSSRVSAPSPPRHVATPSVQKKTVVAGSSTRPRSEIRVKQSPSSEITNEKPKVPEIPLDRSERAELQKLKELQKEDARQKRDILQQLAKKGCNEADRLLRFTDDKIREVLNVEELITKFWEEKVTKPLRAAETRILEKRSDFRDKFIGKSLEKVVEVEKLPKNLENALISIGKWMIPHYQQDIQLPNNFEVTRENVAEVFIKIANFIDVDAMNSPLET